MTIGERIKQKRLALGMSQEELAKRIGYKSRATINKIELSGMNLKQSKIKQIADVLGTTPGWIMGWEDNLTKENASALVDLLASEELMKYSKMLSELNTEDRKMVYDLIDRLTKK